jgi:hypothetical protein
MKFNFKDPNGALWKSIGIFIIAQDSALTNAPIHWISNILACCKLVNIFRVANFTLVDMSW